MSDQPDYIYKYQSLETIADHEIDLARLHKHVDTYLLALVKRNSEVRHNLCIISRGGSRMILLSCPAHFMLTIIET